MKRVPSTSGPGSAADADNPEAGLGTLPRFLRAAGLAGWTLAAPLLAGATETASGPLGDHRDHLTPRPDCGGPAKTFTLTSDNSSVTISPGTGRGMGGWEVDGQDELYTQWFWYRLGEYARETPLNALSRVHASQPTPDTLNTVYANRQLRVEVTYSLQGGMPGSGEAEIAETVLIRNLTSRPLNLHFFEYTDFDLGGSSGGDNVQLKSSLQGLFTEALQSQDSLLFGDILVAPGADHAQAGSRWAILGRLTDCGPTTLNDTIGSMQGNAAWALEWDPRIPARGTFAISITKSLSIVPEPAATSYLLAGWIALGLHKRFRRERDSSRAHRLRENRTCQRPHASSPTRGRRGVGAPDHQIGSPCSAAGTERRCGARRSGGSAEIRRGVAFSRIVSTMRID